MINEGGLIRDPCFGSKVLEASDEFLETIIEGPVFLLKGLLGEFSEVGVGSSFDIEGVEGGFKFSANLLKVFSLTLMAVLNILSYHILKKSMPLPLLILFRVVMILISSVE